MIGMTVIPFGGPTGKPVSLLIQVDIGEVPFPCCQLRAIFGFQRLCIFPGSWLSHSIFKSVIVGCVSSSQCKSPLLLFFLSSLFLSHGSQVWFSTFKGSGDYIGLTQQDNLSSLRAINFNTFAISSCHVMSHFHRFRGLDIHILDIFLPTTRIFFCLPH